MIYQQDHLMQYEIKTLEAKIARLRAAGLDKTPEFKEYLRKLARLKQAYGEHNG